MLQHERVTLIDIDLTKNFFFRIHKLKNCLYSEYSWVHNFCSILVFIQRKRYVDQQLIGMKYLVIGTLFRFYFFSLFVAVSFRFLLLFMMLNLLFYKQERFCMSVCVTLCSNLKTNCSPALR